MLLEVMGDGEFEVEWKVGLEEGVVEGIVVGNEVFFVEGVVDGE